MAEFNHGHTTALVTSMLGTDKTIPELFDEDAFEKFATDHSIPAPRHHEMRQVLALSYAGYLRESKFHDLDVKSIGAKLAAVTKTADALKAALAQLSPDALQAMNDYALGSFTADNLPNETLPKETDPALIARSIFENDATEADYSFDPITTIEQIERMSQIAAGAMTFIRANKRGKRPDERFSTLLLTARFVWEMVLQREFKLYWTDANMPITDAAQFCFDIAKAADPNVKPSKIQRAARLASEEDVLSQLLA
jgi:hypothetical protein